MIFPTARLVPGNWVTTVAATVVLATASGHAQRAQPPQATGTSAAASEFSPFPPSITLAEIVADRGNWPGVITVTTPLEVRDFNGAVRTISAGTPCQIIQITANGVDVLVDGIRYTFPVDKTDLLVRAAKRRAPRTASPTQSAAVVSNASQPPPPSAPVKFSKQKISAWPAGPGNFLPSLTPAIMQLEDNRLSSADASRLVGRQYYLLFHVVQTSPGSMSLLKRMTTFYEKTTEAHHLFEVILVPYEPSKDRLETFAKNMRMRWLIIDPSATGQLESLRAYSGGDVPVLTLVDAGGNTLIDSTTAAGEFDPDRVIQTLIQLVEIQSQAPGKPLVDGGN